MPICQNCRIEGPTKHVEFYQNIGALIIRFHKKIEGNLCKNCINEFFWSFTLTTFALGWWGIISFIVTPFILLNNIGYYLSTLTLPSPDPHGRNLEQQAKIELFIKDISEGLDAGASLQSVSSLIKASGGNEEVASAAIFAATQGKIKHCKQCGSAFKDILTYCSICGSPLTNQ